MSKIKLDGVWSDKELMDFVDDAINDFEGDSAVLGAAIGALMIGRHIGWKPLLLIYDRKTIKKYEASLQLEFREVLPEVGKYAERSEAWRSTQESGGFWRVVKGEIAGIRSKHLDCGKDFMWE